MYISVVVAAVKSGEFDFNETTSMGSPPFYWVHLNNNHNTSQCQHLDTIKYFLRTRSRTLFNGLTNKLKYKANSPVDNKRIKKVEIVAVDGLTTFGNPRLAESAYLKKGRERMQTGAAPTTQEFQKRRPTTERTGTITKSPAGTSTFNQVRLETF